MSRTTTYGSSNRDHDDAHPIATSATTSMNQPAPLSRRFRSLRLAALAAGVFSALAALTSHEALAVGTRSFDLGSLDELSGGDLTGVAVDSRGRVRAGLSLGKTPVSEGASAWSSVQLPDGSVLIGTGNEGKLVRVANGQSSVLATTEQMAVSALAIAWNGDVIAGSFPEGKLFRLPKGQGKGEAAPAFGEKIEGVEYVWALAYDDKSKSLYAATGPEGKVLRIDQNGKAQVHFDAPDPHVTSLALGPDGKVYAGTSGKAMLYRIDAPGRAAVLEDFEGDDVAAIAVAKDGTVWAAVNKYSGFSLPNKSGGATTATPQAPRPSKAGEGKLFRIQSGVVEQMIENKKAHFTVLSLGADGAPYVGTGFEGRVHTVDGDLLERLVADVDERQITSIVMAGPKPYLVTSDPVTVREIRGEGGADAMWTSKVLDAGLRASFGMLTWRGTGQVEVMTRSGNTQEPDDSWSAWSAPLTAPGKVQSPAGRYVQLRARFARDPKALLGELKLAFLTDNVRAVVTSVGADGKSQRTGPLRTGLQSSGGKAAKPSTTVNLKWETENPDKDELRYRVWYRLEGQSQWRDAIKPGEIHTKSDLDWDTSSLPEGLYRVRVEASDELVNPPERTTKHALESSTILVDNTAPLFKSLAINGRKLSGEVSDGLGPIARIEIAVAGTDDWRPLHPVDGIFDEASERFDSDVSSIVPQGSRLVGVRAYDAAGNVVTKELEAK